MKVKAKRNGTGANAHGLDHVTGIEDQGPVISARGHVTENVAIEDEPPRILMSRICFDAMYFSDEKSYNTSL